MRTGRLNSKLVGVRVASPTSVPEFSRTGLVEQADIILRANGSVKLVRRGFLKEVFEPFAPVKLRGKERTFNVEEMERLRDAGMTERQIALALGADQASVSYYLARTTCTRCGVQQVVYNEICRTCKQIDVRNEFAAAMEYWDKLYERREPDFAPELIDLISAHEKLIGPAAFWSREESCIH